MRSALRGARVFWLAVVGISLGFAAQQVRAANIQKFADPGGEHSRPLSDFLLAQGSTSNGYPPLPDYFGWANNDPQNLLANVDYEGLAGEYLASHGGPDVGTQVAGTVTERPLADGRAEVTVILHVKNAITWARPLPTINRFTDPLLFGQRGDQLLADPSLTPALSTCESKVVFINTAPGAPLPDVQVAFGNGPAQPGQELVAIAITASGSGQLHALAGVPEGTPGRIHVIQTGLFLRGSGQGATADNYPVESITLRPVGHSLVSTGGELSKGSPQDANVTAPAQRTSWGRVKALYH
jgi:hypothetical protein